MTTILIDELPIAAKQEPDDLVPNGLIELDESLSDDGNVSYLECLVCNEYFHNRIELDLHIVEHLKQPKLVIERCRVPKIEQVESRSFARKHIRPYKNHISQLVEPENCDVPHVPKIRILLPQQLSDQVDALEAEKARDKINSDYYNGSENTSDSVSSNTSGDRLRMVELQTLSNESQSPNFPGQSPDQPDVSFKGDAGSFWNSDDSQTNGDDGLQIQEIHESGEKEAERHDSLLQNFLNDTVDNISPKDPGMIIPHNETEFISLDRLAGPQCSVCSERFVDQTAFDVHCKSTGHYNNSIVPFGTNAPSSHNSSLDSLTNLPMQQLAQQVNRLSNQGVHQQNILINVQQFGNPMPPPPPPPFGGDMPPHIQHMPHYPHQPPHPMYMPHSQYHPPPPPPHPMYYSGAAGPGMYGPPQPPHPMHPGPHSGAHQGPHPGQHPGQNSQNQRQPPYRDQNQMMPPRLPPPRMPPPSQMRGPQQPPMRSQQPMRGQMPPRNGPPRPSRPNGPHMQGVRLPQGQPRMMLQKRPAMPDPSQIKKKRLDVLIPDTNDNDDCHVISMQKCNDGLPIIKNVQGAATTPGDDPVVHLTDSITLSVRNPKDAPPASTQQVQKKNDAKAVANILATRGITVTPAMKTQKEGSPSPNPPKEPPKPVAINLNSAVSIIPTARNQQNGAKPNGNAPSNGPKTATVDLTEDDANPSQKLQAAQAGKRTLPHQCDLCPAQYPSMRTLMIHRRQYHKAGPQSELGIPIVDLGQQQVLTKLAALGIHSYIPLPQTGQNPSGTFGLPIVSVNAARNPNVCNIASLGSGAVLTLGPLHHISNIQPTRP